MTDSETIIHFRTNPFLNSAEKQELIDNDVLLISSFDANQKAVDIFDNCVIGAMKNAHGDLVAVYHFERLVFAHWWDFSGQLDGNYDNKDDDFEDDFGRFSNWEDYLSDPDEDEDEDEDVWYHSAYEFVSTQYIMNMMGNWSNKVEKKYFLMAEGNPDLVYDREESGDVEDLIQFQGRNYILHG
jgi:hypothetical protein